MPLKIVADKEICVYPTEQWKSINIKSDSIVTDRNFYVVSRKM